MRLVAGGDAESSGIHVCWKIFRTTIPGAADFAEPNTSLRAVDRALLDLDVACFALQ